MHLHRFIGPWSGKSHTSPKTKGRHGHHRVHHPRSARRPDREAIVPVTIQAATSSRRSSESSVRCSAAFSLSVVHDPLDEFFDISTWLTAIVGSMILLGIYRVVVDRGHETAP